MNGSLFSDVPNDSKEEPCATADTARTAPAFAASSSLLTDVRRKAQCVLDTHATSYPAALHVSWNREWLDGFASDVLALLDTPGAFLLTDQMPKPIEMVIEPEARR